MNQHNPVVLFTDETQNLCRKYRSLWCLACANPHRLDDETDVEAQRIWTALHQCEEQLLQDYSATVVVAMRK
jgi:hypothetical protein